MAQLVIFFTAQQNASEDIVDLTAIGIGQANDNFGEEIWIEVVIDMLLPVFRRVKQLGAAALFKLQIEKNDIRWV